MASNSPQPAIILSSSKAEGMSPQLFCGPATSSLQCLNCGGYLPRRPPSGVQKYCSRKCHYEHVRATTRAEKSIPCSHCGKPFYRAPPRVRGRFCGMRCFRLAKILPEKRICPICGQPKAHGSQKSCRGCWARSQLLSEPVPCCQCGNLVYRSPAKWAASSRKHGAFCGHPCFALFTRGQNNPAYIDGKNPAVYPRHYRHARKIVLERDGRCCFLCSKDGWLDIHHINRDKLDNSPTNLVALCRLCHNHQKGTPAESIRLSNRLYRLLSAKYGYPRRSITSKSKATTITLQMEF